MKAGVVAVEEGVEHIPDENGVDRAGSVNVLSHGSPSARGAA
jgi:hypothetical protein